MFFLLTLRAAAVRLRSTASDRKGGDLVFAIGPDARIEDWYCHQDLKANMS
jgi:hypothetical protein